MPFAFVVGHTLAPPQLSVWCG